MRAWLQNYNTLRNQILAVCLLVMALVLCFVGLVTYNRVSVLITNNAERQLQQTAIEAVGRLETLYRQVDMLSSQVMTTTEVQQLLMQEAKGQPSSLKQRQSLMQSVSTFQVYSDGIHAFDLYTKDYRSLFPLDETTLLTRVGPDPVRLADEAKGRLVWIGDDPRDPSYFLAVRQVRLMDRWFDHGGYLLMRINRGYFDLGGDDTDGRREYMMLYDQKGGLISSNYSAASVKLQADAQQKLTIGGESYIQVRQTSGLTDWQLVILSPVSSLTEGINVLRTAIVVSGVVGFLICLICSFFLSAMITRPILRLIKTMRGARLGELRPTPEMQSTVELNELTKTYNQLVGHMNDLIQVIYEKELVRSRTELKALQAQINPHFLYNTLEALYWALQEKDEEELADLVVAMSELFRYTIGSESQSEWVTVKDELEHIERYMQMMKLRFGDQLAWHIDAPSECLAVRIPKLLIQPLVENAILHGVGNKKGHGAVSLVIQRIGDGDRWLVQVKDDGPGMEQQMVHDLMRSLATGGLTTGKGSGLALANVNKRLQLYYKDEALEGLQITSALGEGTIAQFEIPGGT
ncbi:two-component system sensor histidine kinase YesM [Paenibacillus phyllosphaerae]|uniref:Two-component system sensor histidine kinase YesM n=1 Tax=Paenibacillus phyllosphaerae TaxID=274593 RepID=A0A7W5B0P5_9BACL|nr:sensor histidine kinase [Paenibacillus phyllosphaerae]MBB3112279.1 two-component system sensor histidine kinase YesM [Paenibacillus phyllosphaerae]